MKLYLQDNVYEAALKRTERIFQEFENVVVSISGGKDSTVTMHIALEIARKLNRLPLDVMFIDQEDEWSQTIDYIRRVKAMPEIRFHWFQCPVLETNSANHQDQYMCSWDPERKDRWMRPLEPDSIQGDIPAIHKYDDEFKGILAEGGAMIFNNENHCKLGGLRASESLNRYTALTYAPCYKDITWGKAERLGYTFYPLYDWSTSDIWTYIANKHVPYNKIYDLYFNYGVNRNQMRVSSLHHETAYRSMFMLQELDRKTYDKMCARMDGTSMFSKLQEDVLVSDLPEMFSSWKEYRDYLLEKLVRPDLQDIFRKRWKNQHGDEWYQEHVTEILVNDTVGTKNKNMLSAIIMRHKNESGYFARKREAGNY